MSVMLQRFSVEGFPAKKMKKPLKQLEKIIINKVAPRVFPTAGYSADAEAVGKTLAGNIFQLNCCKHAKQLLMAVHTYVFKTVYKHNA